MSAMGRYLWDESGLPVYQYTGPYPAAAKDKQGRDSRQPPDPCFLLGNYRLTAFAHVSGQVELLTGERGWARVNHLPNNDCWNRAELSVNGLLYPLAGETIYRSRKSQKHFGAGYARYQEMTPEGLQVTRSVSIKPSLAVHEGTPALLFQITLENRSCRTLRCAYTEKVLSAYCMLSAQDDLLGPDPTGAYEHTIVSHPKKKLIWDQYRFQTKKLMIPAEDEDRRHPFDCYPPAFYLAELEDGTCSTEAVSDETAEGVALCYRAFSVLQPGESRTVSFLFGLAFGGPESIEQSIKEMAGDRQPGPSAYAALWRNRFPDLSGETDEELRWEMLWNAYTLHAMATYHAYFGETMVPQGSVYAYRLGQNASVRDHLQHSLPLTYLDPALGKSALRYILKQICFDGRIPRQNVGFGYEDKDVYMESDPQLYLFLAVGEYLRISGDHAFLHETVTLASAEDGKKITVLDALRRAFVWLRDVVGVGRHGLIMMRNSDWSDSFFHPYSPNLYCQTAESHLNTAMALAVLPRLIRELERFLPIAKGQAGLARQLMEEMTAYRARLRAAFLEDMEGRVYSPRCYLGFNDDPKLRFGEDRLCLEPQPWLLLMEEFPQKRKRALWRAIQETVLKPERLGARTRERPLWDPEGKGEDGGVWFAHQGPLVLGVAQFSPDEARSLLRQLSFHHFAQCYPDYWLGQWTAADSVESTLSSREGLYAPWCENAFQPYCAHPHAWALYCYFALGETR